MKAHDTLIFDGPPLVLDERQNQKSTPRQAKRRIAVRGSAAHDLTSVEAI